MTEIVALGSARSPATVAAELDRLSTEANDPDTGALFAMAAAVLRQDAPARRARGGRRPITDAAALELMAAHNAARRAQGLHDNDREAARTVVRSLGIGSHSTAAAVDRLRRKFRSRRRAVGT